MPITSFTGKNSFLNTYYPCSIEDDGLVFPTLENAFQASRCSYKTDRKRFQHISPAEAKKLGCEVTIKTGWKERQIEEMRRLLSIKFEDKVLATMLLKTGKEDLIYTNTWHDTFWGVDGTGSNHLGRLLMEQREIVRRNYEGAEITPKQLAMIKANGDVLIHLNAIGLQPEDLPKGVASRIIANILAKQDKEESDNGTDNQ